ncbi:4-hydroxy-tetrahydrodipicolinate reductase [Bacteroidota bacterium]
MKIALLGYGKMGKEVEKIARERNHEIILKIDNNNDWKNKSNLLQKAQVAIDFSMPDVIVSNIHKCFEKDLPVIVGTTGWYDQLEEVKKLCIEKEQSLLYASNFSIGVNVFFEVNKKLAKLMNKFNEYNVLIKEIHHTQKLDAPSGTAISLANDIIKIIERKEEWVKALAQSDSEFEIKSVRKDNVTGTHIIEYDSEIDTIEIKHTAKNRKGFALGAILASEWIFDKKGFFDFSVMLDY